MRKLLFLIPVFFHALAFGQIDIMNMTATNNSVAILYIGTENILKLKGNADFSNYRLEVSGSNSKVEKIETDKYLVRVYRIDTCTISVTRNGKQLFSKQYKTEVIPYPIAIAGATRDTVISKNKLLLNPFLSVIIADCYYAHNTRVISFQATFIANGDSIATVAIGNYFSGEQIKLAKQLQRGDKIWFDQVNGSCPSSRTQRLKSFAITIE